MISLNAEKSYKHYMWIGIYFQLLRAISEDYVKARVIEWLGKHDYVVQKAGTLAEHGVDIKAKKARSNYYFLVECRGDPAGAKNMEKSRNPGLISVLGEMVLRMTYGRTYRYGIAVPEAYASLIRRRVSWKVAQKLGLEFLLVKEGRGIRRLTWRQLRSLQVAKRGRVPA
jgi:hypothetical protein